LIWLGILTNLAFALPALFAPSWLLTNLSLSSAHPLIWLNDAGGLLFFLTCMYVPAAADPFRYRVNAAVAVVGRVAFGIFWFWQVAFAAYPREYLNFSYVDGTLGVLQAIVYVLLLRHEYLHPAQSDTSAGQ
jgi:hypothetical protein